MKTPRLGTKCLRCRQRYGAHLESFLCPDGSGRTFKRHLKAHNARNSFDEREVNWLAQVLQGVAERKDLSALACEPECAKVLRKAQAMRRAAEASKARGREA